MKKKRLLLFFLCLKSIAILAQEQPKFYFRGLLDMWKKNASTTQKRIDAYNKLIPSSIQQNVVLSIGASHPWYYTKNVSNYTSFINDNYLELCKRVDSTGISYLVNINEIGNYQFPLPEPPDTFLVTTPVTTSYYMRPSQVDKIFANTKNCLGIESGENFWTYNATTVNDVLNFLRVCKKYNKKYYLGEGGWGYSTWLRFFSENYTALKTEGLGKYLVPLFKQTKPYAALVSESAIMGAWMTGLTAGFGNWNDEWGWTYHSFNHANQFPIYQKADNNYVRIPVTHYLKTWLLSIAMGGNAAFMESPTWSRSGIPDANHAPYIVPFIKGVAEHNIMPSKAAVIAKVKAMANPFGLHTLTNNTKAQYSPLNIVSYQDTTVPFKWSWSSAATFVDPFGRFYKNTYGIWKDTAYTNTGTVTDIYFPTVKNATGKNYLLNAVLREVLPNNPRFMIIPLLPSIRDSSNIPFGTKRVDLNTLITDSAYKAQFNGLYPASLNENGAWAIEIDNSFFVINSHENADIDQNFTFQFGDNDIESMSGKMPLQNLLFGKCEGVNNYWFQSIGYAVADNITTGQKYICPVKKTILQFKCKFEPTIEVEDNKGSEIIKTWDSLSHMLQLQINHRRGAVNFRITVPQGPLPIIVKSFSANQHLLQTTLRWETTEIGNFSHYEVEYSTDAIHYLNIGKVQGGSSTTVYTYKHQLVASLMNCFVYYRLKMVDTDGRSIYSAIQKVEVNNTTTLFKVIPTIAKNTIQILFQGNELTNTFSLKIIQHSGKVVLSKENCTNGINIDVSKLTKGTYIVVVYKNGRNFSEEIIVM